MSKVKRVVVGIIKKDGKYLMLKHNKCKGLYLFPSGNIEENESSKEAMVREMEEEIGIKVKLSFISMSYLPSWYDRVDGIMLTSEDIHIIEEYEEEPYNKEPNKHEEMVWVSPKEVFENPQKFTHQTFKIMAILEDEIYDKI